MNRVFHIAGLSWGLVSLAVLGAGFPAHAIAAGAALCLMLFRFGRKRPPLWMISAAAAVCFCALSLLCRPGLAIRAGYVGTDQRIRGVVTDQVFLGQSVESTLRLTPENPAGLENARIRIRSRAGVEESIGDVVEYAVRLQASDPAALWARGFDFEAFGEAPRLLGHTNAGGLALLRREMSSRFLRLLPNGEGALLSGLLLGRTEAIPQMVRRDYARAGISHLLAVSGLHLTVMLALFGILLRRLPRTARILAEMALAAAFAAFTGFPPSMIRAAAMLTLCRAALLLGRDSDALNSLGFSILCILLVNPFAVFSVSLQLSYLAAMGISAFAEPMACWLGRRLFSADLFALSETRPRTAAVLSGICVTLSAQVLTAPLSCWYFGMFSLISPAVNLLTALPLTVMLLSGMLCAGLGFVPFLEPLCRLAAFPAGITARLVSGLAHFCGGLPFAAFPVQDGCIILWLSVSTFLIILLWYLRCTRAQVLWSVEWMACALAAALCARLVFWGHPVTVCVPEYGQTVLILYGEQAALIGTPKNAGEADRLAAMIGDQNINSLCLLVAEKSGSLENAAARRLLRMFPPEETVALDTCDTFEARLFGRAVLSREADGIRIDAGVSILKTFGMSPAAAHVLINERNEVISAPDLRLPGNCRYYGSRRIFLPFPEDSSAGEAETHQ